MRLEGTLRGNLVPPPSQSKVNYTYDIPERHLSNLFLKKNHMVIEVLQPPQTIYYSLLLGSFS